MSDYHRNLPHWLPEGRAIFLTWRLYGSLPGCVLQKLRAEKVLTAGQEFARADQHLDRAVAGPLWLKDIRIAECVSHCLELGDSKFHQYDLYSFVVMANHVHALLSRKSRTATHHQKSKRRYVPPMQSNPPTHQTTVLATRILRPLVSRQRRIPKNPRLHSQEPSKSRIGLQTRTMALVKRPPSGKVAVA